MKKLLFSTLLLFCFSVSFGAHLKGGFFTYKYLGTSNGKLQYSLLLTVYMDKSAFTVPVSINGQVTPTIPITIFNASNNLIVQRLTANIKDKYLLSRTFDDVCLSNEPLGPYYTIVTYEIPLIELTEIPAGYVLSFQRCCRISDINNIQAPSNDIGNTYSVSIPGTSTSANAPKNSSATFLVNDTAVICQNSFFQLPFVASDPDGDSLSYSFCAAWVGGGPFNDPPGSPGGGLNTPAPDPAGPPPYATVPYSLGFTGSFPLGTGVTINPVTGLISGIAPAIGEYVVTVCVNEYKSGALIATTRKELHVIVGDCGAVQATLQPQYVNCDNNSVVFSNATDNGVTDHFWDFGVTGATNDTSNIAAPTFTYPDSGTYTLTLIVNRKGPCTDTSTSVVKVYPGFFPGFISAGVCATKPTQFTDTTRTRYGFVNSWSWDFGEPTVQNDTSHLQHPAYSYPLNGTKNVRFIVTSNKGCIDTVFKDIVIMDKPPLTMPFRDTLICNGDTLQLHAVGTGTFSWTPNIRILNANTADPLVFPQTTTSYIAQLNDNGCLNTDTVRVRVVDFVSLQATDDKGICLTDSVQLGATTNGLRFEWTPAADFSNPTLLAPFARPTAAFTEYTITAHIGHCSATDRVVVRTSPYPQADAGADTVICYNTPAFLNGRIVGTSFSWTPAATLTSANTLTPIARPRDTARYILTVFDGAGFCPKPVRDTVLVSVVPKINASAGRDTSVVVGQPLQFTAGGGVAYNWVPATGLNNAAIFNPVGTYTGAFDSIRYKVLVSTVEGCVDSAFVRVKIFKTIPKIFVPTAFTPNGDTRNDAARPIAVGIKKIDYFRIYNRWGQLVFETTANGRGWDGKIGGREQGTGVFVWLVKATDYLGKSYFDKGTITLIR